MTRTREPIESAAAMPLLEACRLPLAGLESTRLWAAREDGALVGVAGLETFGDVVLLRSVATDPAWRGRGVARGLCEGLLEEARSGGARRAFLLTESAEEFFRGLGFETVPRDDADPRLLASAEFQEGRCASAKLMTRRL